MAVVSRVSVGYVVSAVSAVSFVTMSSPEVWTTLAGVTTDKVNTLGSILAGITNPALIHV